MNLINDKNYKIESLMKSDYETLTDWKTTSVLFYYLPKYKNDWYERHGHGFIREFNIKRDYWQKGLVSLQRIKAVFYLTKNLF